MQDEVRFPKRWKQSPMSSFGLGSSAWVYTRITMKERNLLLAKKILTSSFAKLPPIRDPTTLKLFPMPWLPCLKNWFRNFCNSFPRRWYRLEDCHQNKKHQSHCFPWTGKRIFVSWGWSSRPYQKFQLHGGFQGIWYFLGPVYGIYTHARYHLLRG